MGNLISVFSVFLFITFNILLLYYAFIDKLNLLPPKIKSISIGFLLTLVSILLTTILHSLNVFDVLEHKLFDYRMEIRGYLSGDLSLDPIPKVGEKFQDSNENGKYDFGENFEDLGNGIWDNNELFEDLNENGKYDFGENFEDLGNGKFDNGLNVVLVEIDDESYRLIDESYPFPRGRVYARAIRNLTKAGAKVIFFDIMFDKPDHQSETIIKEFGNNIPNFIHGDEEMKNAILYARENGTEIILGSKVAEEPTRIPPFYYLEATDKLMEANPLSATVGVPTDIDGVNRKYLVYQKIPGDETWYISPAIKAVSSFLEVNYDVTSIVEDRTKGMITFFDKVDTTKKIVINTYGENYNVFKLNYYGPASGAKTGIEDKRFKTFNRYPLANIIDDSSYDLDPIYEDTNWMDQFLPGIVPDYILAIEDLDQRKLMMDMLGIGTNDLTKSPFYNKIVVVGTALPEDQDTKVTPFYNVLNKQILMPGMEVHATAIQQIIDKNYISFFNKNISYNKSGLYLGFFDVVDFLIIFSLGLLTFLIFTFTSPIISGILVLFSILGWFIFSIGIFVDNQFWFFKYFLTDFILLPPDFNKSIFMPIIFPISSIILTYAFNLAYKLITEGQDKAFLKASFGSYISPELIDQMYESKQAPSLGGIEGHNTPFFSDIASFSTFSEKLSAEDLVILLNEYLNEMTNILLNNKGTLDKYIGDAIIAFFGAPVKLKNQEYLACLTCCQMNEKLEELRTKWKSQGNRWPSIVHNMRHRIGVNCGSVVTGNMGSDMRMNYTMMGDTVNVTARLESGAKQYGIETQVGEKVFLATKNDFVYRIIDYAIVKGRTQPSRTYELIAQKGKESQIYKNLLPLWDEAIKNYYNQNWDKAIKLFNECEKYEEEYIGRPTNPSSLYIDRCKEFKQNPPDKDWDGSYKLKSK